MKTEFNLAGKRVLLVGSTGVLGRTYAESLTDAGVNLVIADHPKSDVGDLASVLGIARVEMDVSCEEDVVNGVARAIDQLGEIDGVVNNAAATGEGLLAEGEAFAPLEEYPLALWQKTIDINLTGTFLVARECGRHMKSHGKGGSIINVASIYGVVGPDHRIYEGQSFKSFPGYSASKAGVIGLTRWLATWWGKDGIRVNTLTPGGVFNNHNEEFANAYSNKTPLGRMADKNDMTGMLCYLLSDLSRYCTGQNYIVDGGFTAW